MAAENSCVYRFEDHLLDLAEHQLSRRGQEIHLRPKTFKVLVCLVERHGHLVTKEELLEIVWPKTYVTERTLQTSISEIREALDDRADHSHLIKTIPKVGYQFVAEVKGIPSESATVSTKTWRRMAIALAATMSLLAILLWWNWDYFHKPVWENPSIAVLRFKNFSADSADEYIGDAITDTLITKLTRISGLSVVSYGSAEYYKDNPKRPRAIAEELRVKWLVEGSLRIENRLVHVNAQLIDGQTEGHLWADEYVRPSEETVLIPADIAQALIPVLRVQLSQEEETKIRELPTDNLEAYSLYQEGRYYRQQETMESQRKASELFREAVERDPSFALAWAELAASYAVIIAKSTQLTPEERDQRGLIRDKALRKATELDDSIPLVHVLKANRAWNQRDLAAAEASFKRALELDPRNLDALVYYAGLLWASPLGRLDEAFSYLTQLKKLDPIASVDILTELHLMRGDCDKIMENALRALEFRLPGRYLDVGLAYYGLGEHGKAQPWIEKACELEPEHFGVKRYLFLNYLYQGRMDQAARIAQPLGDEFLALVALWTGDYGEAKQRYRNLLEPRSNQAKVSLGYILWKEGEQDAARQLLSEVAEIMEERIAAGNQRFREREWLTVIHAIQGNTEIACKWFQDAVDAGWREFRKVERDPLWENLRSEPQFQQLMAEVKVDADRMHRRIEAMEPTLGSYLAN